MSPMQCSRTSTGCHQLDTLCRNQLLQSYGWC